MAILPRNEILGNLGFRYRAGVGAVLCAISYAAKREAIPDFPRFRCRRGKAFNTTHTPQGKERSMRCRHALLKI